VEVARARARARGCRKKEKEGKQILEGKHRKRKGTETELTKGDTPTRQLHMIRYTS
jgi:hypothetical protein